MLIKDALADVPIKRADAEILLAHLLLRDRTWILAHGDDELTNDKQRAFGEAVKRRSRGEPVAYIKGEKEFYGKIFTVNSDVLIPRDSTEGLVDLVQKVIAGSVTNETISLDEGIIGVAQTWGDEKPTMIIDVGTGSGCIAITLARLLPVMSIGASDSSASALRVAATNARRHMMEKRVKFREGRGLEPWKDIVEPFLLVSNPPYIPAHETLMDDVMHFEPHEALFAGERGVDVVEPLIKDARAHPRCVGFVLECREDQASAF